jgi:hypothetical protein
LAIAVARLFSLRSIPPGKDCAQLLGELQAGDDLMDVHLAALLMVGIALSYILLRAFWI